jgi:hypothetical protein
LINDEFFIDLTNGIAKALEALESLIDRMGGLGGIAMRVGGIFLTKYAKEIPSAIEKMTANLSVFTGKAKKETMVTLTAMSGAIDKQINQHVSAPKIFKSGDAEADATAERINERKAVLLQGSSTDAELHNQKEMADLRLKYLDVEKNLSEAEKEAWEHKLRSIEATLEENLAL